jgi:hypothetical protein
MEPEPGPEPDGLVSVKQSVLVRAVREIEESNAERKYYTGQRFINELRRLAGMEAKLAVTERNAESGYW